MKFHRAVDRSRAVAKHTRTARAVDCSRAVDSSPTFLPPPFAASRRLLKKSKEHQLLEQLSTRYPTARAVNNRRLEQSTTDGSSSRRRPLEPSVFKHTKGHRDRESDFVLYYVVKSVRCGIYMLFNRHNTVLPEESTSVLHPAVEHGRHAESSEEAEASCSSPVRLIYGRPTFQILLGYAARRPDDGIRHHATDHWILFWLWWPNIALTVSKKKL
uniref:SFRICE_010271 n=1 Tax=Spodoptera frugiperda TaxID=7108 RepID=A0A2H1WPX0_SPOFR